ncbi:hypothetical protein PULV_a2957 [Pseudoalteromonas ulvae UL12]|uniref:Inosine/xanthosine triphosphatase n=1 Tax=Pseudoalteromonas ulvae TaxID=107327 RepID=A0A244CW42_PSEDV|nr:inosine/xanthosine triphosphatase [Pseudoalteromonas ulvae]MBE0362343.1 hypothetical protein [Pseudoalteromonas ulvae UL12]OUL59646.1 inosine/xanthosine triphosphatase [Pseudoalteromonas ulvae]
MKKTLSILVGSMNPVKINAVHTAFSQAFPDCDCHCQGIHAPSKVAEQPMTEQETLDGAINRVKFCQQTPADFYVAIEGGVDHFSYGPATFAFIVIASQHQQSIGRSANLPLPNSIYQALQAGQELGPLMDSLFNTDNIKQKGGAISLLTNGLASRESNYHNAMILALAPFINQAHYS